MLFLVRSFIELTKLLLDEEVFECFLSDKLNQDPLEKHFGRHRMKGGANENPSVNDYGYSELKIIASRSETIQSVRGNVRERQKDPINIHDDTPLPKRPKK